MINKLIVCFTLVISGIFHSNAHGRILRPVNWSFAAKRTSKNEAAVFFKAAIDQGRHIYSANQEEGGAVKASFTFERSNDFKTIRKIVEPVLISKYENLFNRKAKYIENSVIFRQEVNLILAHPVVRVWVNLMVCNNQKCLLPEKFKFSAPMN